MADGTTTTTTTTTTTPPVVATTSSSSVRFSTAEGNLSNDVFLLDAAANNSNDGSHNNTNNHRNMQLFMGTANLGNAAPDELSWNAWIPADGYYGTTTNTDHNKYPLRRMIYNKTNNDSTTMERNHVKVNVESNNEYHYCMDTLPPSKDDNTGNDDSVIPRHDSSSSYQQYDILIFGMQEATFDPPVSSSPSKNLITKIIENAETTTDDSENNNKHQNPTLDAAKNESTKEHQNNVANNTMKIKSPIQNTVQVVHDTLSHTTTKAVHTTTKAVQKIHRTTEKTINKVQTLSTSRDHCKNGNGINSPQRKGSKVWSSFPSGISSSSFLFAGGNSKRRNQQASNTIVNENGDPLLNAIKDDESNYNNINTDTGNIMEMESLLLSTTNTTTGWLNGTTYLLQLYQQRLPSYVPIVNYQRGEMRLVIYIHKKHIHDIQVNYVTAQNTGRAGLANKGGIVTELLCYHQTRISFVTAHLEAHEGYTKYMTRIQSITDIFNGTTRHHPTTTVGKNNNKESSSSTSSSSPVCIHDCSVASHYSFVMGDLNFRTHMSDEQKKTLSINDEDEYKQMIHQLITNKQYDTLNDMDELHRGLYNKHCLVGYETLLCNFSPTFKVERQPGYHYIEKRRPSYTDRILYKCNVKDHSKYNNTTNTTTIQPLLYEPIDNFQSSDHKPIRAAFTIKMNEPYMLRPKLTKRRSSTLKLVNLIHTKKKNHKKDYTSSLELGQKDRFHLFVTNMKCDIIDLYSKNSNQKLSGSNSFSLVTSTVTSTLQEIYTGIPSPYICLISNPSDLLRHHVEKKWNLFCNNAIQRTSLWKSSSNKRGKANTNHTCFLNTYGFPRSSIQRQKFIAEWDHNEEIHTEIRTHHADGSPIDLSGAMLHISVMNHRRHGHIMPRMIHKTTSAVTGSATTIATDTVIGTVTINLVDLMRQCRISPVQQRNGVTVKTGQNDALAKVKMEGGVEVQLTADSMDPFAKTSTAQLTEIVDDNIKNSAASNQTGRNNTNIDEDDDDDPIVRVGIDEAIVKNGIETGRLQCQLEIWYTDGTITKAFAPHSSAGSNNNSTKLLVGRRKRSNNRKNIPPSDTEIAAAAAASNYPRRPPLIPDRRTAATDDK